MKGWEEAVCECNLPSSLVTVFRDAKIFNGDLSTWDVSRVTYMDYSKLYLRDSLFSSCVVCESVSLRRRA